MGTADPAIQEIAISADPAAREITIIAFLLIFTSLVAILPCIITACDRRKNVVFDPKAFAIGMCICAALSYGIVAL